MKLEDISRRIINYYVQENNEAGGSLHIVLDDGNLEDVSIEYCIGYASRANDSEGVAIGNMLLGISLKDRQELYDDNWERGD